MCNPRLPTRPSAAYWATYAGIADRPVSCRESVVLHAPLAIGIRPLRKLPGHQVPHLRGRTDRHHSSGLPRSRRTAAHPARNPIHRPRVRRQSSTASG
jgi:hypothetical protein